MEIIEYNNDGENMNNNELEFPEGMRVLAVDDNLVCLFVLTTLLKKCRYQVTSLTSKTEALELLKQNSENFDIVLTNVYSDEMEGFKVLEAGIELDIPVVMISSCDSKDIIKKGVRHGVVHYMIKPVRLQDVQTIWQPVYRKKLTSNYRMEKIIQGNLMTNGGLKNEDENPMNNNLIKETQGDVGTSKSSKRGGLKKGALGDDENVIGSGSDYDNPTEKRERFKWTEERSNKFNNAVDRLGGIDKAVPKRILELMDEPGVTREQVASHLQKFRKNRKEIVSNQFTKDNRNNHKSYYHHTRNPSLMGSSMTSIFGHQPVPSNTMPQGLLGPGHYHQGHQHPINTNVCPRTPPVGYTSLLSSTNRTNQWNMPHQRMISNEGSFMSSSSNFMFQQPYQQPYTQPFQQHPQELPMASKLQSPEEFFDCGPSIADSTQELCPSNDVFDLASGYPTIIRLS